MMYSGNLVFCCVLFQFFDLFVESLQNSMNNDSKQDDDSTARYKFHANSIKNRDNEAEFVQYDNFIKHNNNNNIPNTNSRNNRNDNENHIVPYEMCDNITCIQLCCPLGYRLVNKNCTAGGVEYIFPNVYEYSNDSLQSKNKTVDELFQLIVQYPCQETEQELNLLFNSDHPEKKYIFFANGSLYLPYFDIFVETTTYCLAIVDHNQFDAISCSETVNKIIEKEIDNIIYYDQDKSNKVINLCCHIVSLLSLLTIFLVYSILSEFHSIHSFMLRIYSSLLFITYTFEIIDPAKNLMHQTYSICIISALIKYFCYVTPCFWLFVMSFDMWWTFRELRLLEKKVKQEQKKKLIYSMFAFGGPFILTIICIIMDFFPSVPKNLIRPKFGIYICWFHEITAYQLYLVGPLIICTISSVCLLIYTALKVKYYEKDAIRHLRDSESRCYNDSKKWFNLYLRLFIVMVAIMGTTWFAARMSQLFPNTLAKHIIASTIWFISTMKNLSFFIIFVCKKTIFRLLLKRLGC